MCQAGPGAGHTSHEADGDGAAARSPLGLAAASGPGSSRRGPQRSEPPLSDIEVAPGVMGPATGTVARKGPLQDAPPSARATYMSVEATLNSVRVQLASECHYEV